MIIVVNKYYVITTKHHDGFTLWPSAVKHPNEKYRNMINSKVDLVKKLST